MQRSNYLAIFTYIKAEIATLKKLYSPEDVANILKYLVNLEEPVTYNNNEIYRIMLKKAGLILEQCLLEPSTIPAVKQLPAESLVSLKKFIQEQLKKEWRKLKPLSNEEFCQSLCEALQAAHNRYQQRLRQDNSRSSLVKGTSKLIQSIAGHLKPDVKKCKTIIDALYKNTAQHQTDAIALLEGLKTAAGKMKELDTYGEKAIEGFLHDLKDEIKIRPIEDVFEMAHIKGDLAPLCDALLKAQYKSATASPSNLKHKGNEVTILHSPYMKQDFSVIY